MQKSSLATLATAATCLGRALGLSSAAYAQSDETAAPQSRLHGQKDPKTGVFHPDNAVVPEAGTVSPLTGTFSVTLHITLKTAVPSGDKVGCTADVLADDTTTTGNTSFTEEVSAIATVSGSTATCVMTIPFSWVFPSGTVTEILTGSYTAMIFNPSATITTATFLTRSSGSDFVDVTGANVFATAPRTFSVNVTL
jgi:hypothetical protein